MGYCAKGEYKAYITRYDDEIEIEIIDSWELTTVESVTCDNEDFFETLEDFSYRYNITKLCF